MARPADEWRVCLLLFFSITQSSFGRTTLKSNPNSLLAAYVVESERERERQCPSYSEVAGTAAEDNSLNFSLPDTDRAFFFDRNPQAKQSDHCGFYLGVKPCWAAETLCQICQIMQLPRHNLAGSVTIKWESRKWSQSPIFLPGLCRDPGVLANGELVVRRHSQQAGVRRGEILRDSEESFGGDRRAWGRLPSRAAGEARVKKSMNKSMKTSLAITWAISENPGTFRAQQLHYIPGMLRLTVKSNSTRPSIPIGRPESLVGIRLSATDSSSPLRLPDHCRGESCTRSTWETRSREGPWRRPRPREGQTCTISRSRYWGNLTITGPRLSARLSASLELRRNKHKWMNASSWKHVKPHRCIIIIHRPLSKTKTICHQAVCTRADGLTQCHLH